MEGLEMARTYMANELRDNEYLRDELVKRVNRGKKVKIEFLSEEQKMEFCEATALFAASVGAELGGTIGAVIGGAIGSALGGVGAPIGVLIGGGIGATIGAITGYSIGVWLAKFLWENILNKNNITINNCYKWFGLRHDPNKVKVYAPAIA